ncbi:autophagy protein Apg17-domain-containing protein [Amylocystis lapponica]|nr:autophagy protein Apg17-domain-containing protein [Amylocystis lapponica]
MATLLSNPTSPDPGQPHLVSLVLQSKKALQHGEQLCSRASSLSSTSAQHAVDVLALDAKVRWITDAVLQQLRLAAHVAKSIDQKRSQLEKQAEEWDILRNQRTDSLDAILDSLGSQAVPHDFHSASAGSSPFGSQPDSDEEDGRPLFGEQEHVPSQSPTETLRARSAKPKTNGISKARSAWKTLRDFVDERAVEDVLDVVESDRNAVDDILARTADYPESLSTTISAIEARVPLEIPLPSFQDIFTSQETASVKMAGHLESLTAHFEQMAATLRDSEAGEEFDEEDIQQMNRDTDELPAIIAELEDSVSSIAASHEQLLAAKRTAQQHLDTHRQTLDDLDELGEIISEMLERQQAVETESTEHIALLHHHLVTVEDLHHRFASYQYSYNKLLLELQRRRQYREAANNIVRGMMAQLSAMTEEERQLREEFSAVHGQYLPEDVCLYVQNAPTRWSVVPWNGEQVEILPELEDDLVQEAKDRTARADGPGLAGSQSL